MSHFRRDVVWMVLGNGVYALSQGGMLVVLARLSTPEVLGEFALAIAFTTPIFLLSRLSLREVLATDAASQYRFRDYVATTGGTSVLAIAAIWVAATLLYSPDRLEVLMLVGASRIPESFSLLLYGLRQKHGQMHRAAMGLAVRGLTAVIGLAIGLGFGDSLTWGVGGMAVASCLALLVVDLPGVHKVIPTHPTLPAGRGGFLFGKLIWMTFPLGASTVLLALQQSIPRLHLERAVGTFELGIFGVMGWVAVAGSTLVLAAGQAATPRIGEHVVERDLPALRNLMRRLLAFSGACGLVGLIASVLLGRWILDALFGAEYAAYQGVLVLTMVAGFFGLVGLPLGFAMIAARKLWSHFWVSVLGVAAVALAGVALIPHVGIHGAAWALIIASVVQLSVSVLVVGRAKRELARPRDAGSRL